VLLASTVLVALVGGLLPALAAAVVGFLTLNWFFTPPFGRLTVAQPRNVLVLVVFVAVAVGVATVVDRAARRAAEAARARAEAATLGALSRSVLTGDDTAEAVVARLRETFAQESVSLLARDPSGWRVVAAAPPGGAGCATRPDEGDAQVAVDDDHVLVLRGTPLRAGDRRVLEGFAVQTGLVLEYRRLRAGEERARALESAERTSTALLRAVSHDLRTPLATMRAAVDGLQVAGLPDDDRAELVRSVDDSTDQLERLIDNLLDLSRLESGLVHPRLRAHSLEEVLPLAVAGQPPGAVVLDVDESVPLVATDAGLLERVVANVVSNAVRVSCGEPVRIGAHVLDDVVEVLVVDRGPGVPPALREHLWEPFQRLDDTTAGGLGLGLAVARGLCEAVGGRIAVDDTPGGGLTVTLTLPRALPEDQEGPR
jgi:two-component system sensor histidine kinase KdpD